MREDAIFLSFALLREKQLAAKGPRDEMRAASGSRDREVRPRRPRPPAWPKYRFRSGPPQILISKFRGAAANFEVDFDCQNASVLPQDRAYRRRTPTRDTPPLNWTRSPPQTRLTRGRGRAHSRPRSGHRIALSRDRPRAPPCSLMASMNGLRSCSKTRLRRLVVWGA